MDGEPAVVAGSVSQSEQRSLNGIPGLGSVPGINKITTIQQQDGRNDELLLVITPHVVATRRARARNVAAQEWSLVSGRRFNPRECQIIVFRSLLRSLAPSLAAKSTNFWSTS